VIPLGNAPCSDSLATGRPRVATKYRKLRPTVPLAEFPEMKDGGRSIDVVLAELVIWGTDWTPAVDSTCDVGAACAGMAQTDIVATAKAPASDTAPHERREADDLGLSRFTAAVRIAASPRVTGEVNGVTDRPTRRIRPGIECSSFSLWRRELVCTTG